MQSLSELNNASNQTITYTDERPSGVNLTYTPITYYNQLDISSTTVLVNQIVDIDEIIKPETANVRYRVEIKTERSPALSGSSIVFATLPSGVTLSTSGSVYTLNGITTVAQWELIKNFTWNLPSNYASSPFWYLEVSIVYFDSDLNLDQSYTWLEFDTRFYYVARMESTVTLRVPSISSTVGTAKQFDLEMLTNFTIEAKTSKSGSVDLYSKFTVVCNIGENPKDVTMNSTFGFLCNSSYGYDRTPTYPSIELGNIRCRSYMDTEFNFNLLPNYNFGPLINLPSAFSPIIVCRWMLLSPVRPTANLISNYTSIIHNNIIFRPSPVLSSVASLYIIPIYGHTYTYNAPLSTVSTVSAIPSYDHTYNITAARTYNKNIGTAIFATNTPYLETGFPTATFKIEISCTTGYLTGASATTPLQLVSYTGTYTTINSKFAEIKYYPVKDSTASTTITFKKYRNSVLQQTISFNLSYSGTVGTFVPSTSIFNTVGTFTYAIPLDSYFYNRPISYAVIGGGGGGSGSKFYDTLSPLPYYGTCKIGNGGWSGSLLVNTNQKINTSTVTNIITGTVGAGGTGSASRIGQASLVGIGTPTQISGQGDAGYRHLLATAVNKNGLFVAVGYGGNNSYSMGSYSTNGTNWSTPVVLFNQAVRLMSIACNPAGLFVAVGTGLYNGISGYTFATTSIDGITWTTPTLIDTIVTSNAEYGRIIQIACNPDGLFVVVSNKPWSAGLNFISSRSTNGVTWTIFSTLSDTTGIRIKSIACNSYGHFIAVGSSGDPSRSYIVKSYDGIVWIGQIDIGGFRPESIACNLDGLFVAVGYDPVLAQPVYSYGTMSGWVGSYNFVHEGHLTDIACNPEGLFVAVGYTGNTYPIYSYSLNGTDWVTPIDAYADYVITSIVCNQNGLFVTIGENISQKAVYSASYVVNAPSRLPADNGNNSRITFSDGTVLTANGGRGSCTSTLVNLSYKLNGVEQLSQLNGQSTELNLYQYGRGLDSQNSPWGIDIQYSILDPAGHYEIGHGGDLGKGSTADSNPNALTINTVTSDLRSLPANHNTTLDYNIPGSGGYGGGFIHDISNGLIRTLQDGGSGKAGAVIFKCHGTVLINSEINSGFNITAELTKV